MEKCDEIGTIRSLDCDGELDRCSPKGSAERRRCPPIAWWSCVRSASPQGSFPAIPRLSVQPVLRASCTGHPLTAKLSLYWITWMFSGTSAMHGGTRSSALPCASGHPAHGLFLIDGCAGIVNAAHSARQASTWAYAAATTSCICSIRAAPRCTSAYRPGDRGATLCIESRSYAGHPLRTLCFPLARPARSGRFFSQPEQRALATASYATCLSLQKAVWSPFFPRSQCGSNCSRRSLGS